MATPTGWLRIVGMKAGATMDCLRLQEDLTILESKVKCTQGELFDGSVIKIMIDTISMY